jgi:predicted transglutaminase-like cysteine proteinase
MKAATALLLIILPCHAHALDMNVQLAGWKNAVQLLARYPLRTHSQHIENFEGKLDAINRAVNAVPYVSDAETYRDADYWQTPIQFMQVGGECRDYAVAKYYALYRLGVADADMQFVAVRIRKTGQFHAILVVQHAGRRYILDNRHSEVLPWSRMADYAPVYSINRLGWRIAR